ncbi:MAG TPA: SulP family inorganic anion transporter [Acidimicrobiales bacterium]|nr:SulP family inorganic anion transporter [Acidimicrobiales bacterium]
MSAGTDALAGWRRWVPLLGVLGRYRAAAFRRDVVAGVVLTALLIPAGMGYAQAAGLPAVTGLYATVVPLVAYAVVGPSRILVLGPDSSLAPLIAAAVLPLSGGDVATAVSLAGVLAVLTGVLCIVAGLARLGFLTDLLSLPVRYGYLNGIAVTILASQLPKLFGFSVDADTAVDDLHQFVDGVLDGRTNTTALAVGASSLAAIFALRTWTRRVPVLLVVIVGAIVATNAFDLADHGLALVGELPRGFPGFSVPTVDAGDLSRLLAGAAGVAIIAFADTTVLSRTFAVRGHYEVDQNQELVALGVANGLAGFFQGFPVSSSASRTPAAEAAGAHTQVTGLVSAAVIVVLLLWLPWLFRDLPISTLAAVVIASAVTIVEIPGVVRLAKAAPGEFAISLVAFAGVAVLGVLPGVGLAVGVALLSFIRRAWAPHSTELVRVDGMKGYHDAGRHPEGRRVPGLILYRFDAPLFFANADEFKERALGLVASAPVPVRWIVVTAEPITSIDSTAAEMLIRLHEDLRQRDAVLAFAELKGHVRERLARFGIVGVVGAEHFYRTVGEAVRAYLAAEHVEWVDWEERSDT